MFDLDFSLTHHTLLLLFEESHDDEVLAARFVNLVNRADVRMIERRGSEGFSLEPLTGSAIVFHFSGQELQRDVPMQLEVFGFVHDTHSARTDSGYNLVRAKLCACG
jgi:hypothetical protein